MSRRPFDQILSVEDLKTTADRLGDYTFSPSTMEFFNSRVCHKLFNIDDSRGYFITSDKEYGKPRKFTVRSYKVWTDAKTGKDFIDIESVGGFGKFFCEKGAKEYAEKRQGYGMLDKNDFERSN